MESAFTQLEPISLQQQAVPQLVARIRDGIRRGDLEPGRRLSEPEFAKIFDISRQPVREAFLLLAQEGLVEIRPQRGTYVRKISLQHVQQVRFVREAIEVEIVRLAVTQLNAVQLGDLRDNLAEQARCSDLEINRFIGLDDQFHRYLASGVGQSHAWSIVESQKTQLDRVRFLSLRHFPTDALLEQHTDIVDAIAERDAARAEKTMRAHLNMVVSDLEVIARNNPEKFQD